MLLQMTLLHYFYNWVIFHCMLCMLSRFSCVQHYATPWTAAHQAPLSTGLSRQEYWSGLPFPSPTDHESQVTHSHNSDPQKLWDNKYVLFWVMRSVVHSYTATENKLTKSESSFLTRILVGYMPITFDTLLWCSLCWSNTDGSSSRKGGEK